MGRRGQRSGADAGRRLFSLIVVVGVIAALPVAVAEAATWNKGDVFAGVSADGTNPTGYKVFDNAGNPKENVGKATSTGFATGCGFDQQDNLYGTYFSNRNVIKFANAHPHPDLQTIDVVPTGAASTESIVFDAAGNFYVGNADGNRDVLKYDAAGNLVDQLDVETAPRGSDWVELAVDQKTLFYTSEGSDIRRYDAAAHAQLTPFATGLPHEHYALRLLPPGDGSGGMLVAATDEIQRLNASGAVVQTYDVPGSGLWFALNLDPNGTSFWSADLSTGNIFRFNINSGAVEVGPIANPGVTVAGLCLLGEPTAATPPEPIPNPYAESECPTIPEITGKSEQGDDANNTITGTPDNDLLRGGGGDDTITGLPGDDCINGQAGNDGMAGDEGNDTILGEDGNDTATGNDGNDTMTMGNEADNAAGGAGNDSITGDAGADTVAGDEDNDLVKGFGDDDTVSGNAGNDRVQGSGGNDKATGEDGDDKVRGGTGSDKVDGGSGKDQVQSQGGKDKIKGGSGKDNIRAGGGDDKVNAVDGDKDKVKCGLGFDKAKVDKVDVVAKDCNQVKVKK